MFFNFNLLLLFKVIFIIFLFIIFVWLLIDDYYTEVNYLSSGFYKKVTSILVSGSAVVTVRRSLLIKVFNI